MTTLNYGPPTAADSDVGEIITDKDLEMIDLGGGVEVLTHKKSGRWITSAGDAMVTPKYRIVNDEGETVIQYRKVQGSEIEALYDRAEKRIAEIAVAAEIDALWAKILSKAKIVQVVSPDTTVKPWRRQTTLDDVERLVEAAGAELSLVRDTAVVVKAPDHVALQVAVDEAGQRYSMGGRSRLTSYERRRHMAEHDLLFALADLGDLGVEYVRRGGKRPPVDVGKGPANKVNRAGAWI